MRLDAYEKSMAPTRRRVTFVPNPSLYLRHYGGGIPVFRGTVYQEGYGLGSLFGSLFRSVIPTLKTTALSAGKTLLQSGADVVGDIVEGRRGFKDAVKHRGIQGLKTIGKEASTSLLRALAKTRQQSGSGGYRGRSRKRRRVTTIDDIFNKPSRKVATRGKTRTIRLRKSLG